MRPHLLTFACLCSCAVLITAIPLPANDQELDVLQIPLSDGKELDVLTLSAKDQEQLIADRNKRTVGLLRELFPEITQQLDSIVNRIIAQVIRAVGPQVFPLLLGQNRPSTGRPNIDTSFDDDDDDDDDTDNNNNENNNSRVQVDLPTFPPDSDEVIINSNTSVLTTQTNRVSVRNSEVTTTSMPINEQLLTTTRAPSFEQSIATETTPATTITTTRITNIFLSPSNIPLTTTTSLPSSSAPPSPPPTSPPPSSSPPPSPSSSPPPASSSSSSSSTTTTSTSTSTTTTPAPTTLATSTSEISTISNNLNLIDSIVSRNSFDGIISGNSIENSQFKKSIDVDESQLVALIDNINNLLNTTNYFITTRDNLTSTTTTSIQPTASTQQTTTTTANPITTTTNGATDTQIDLSAINKQLEETIRVARQVKAAEEAAAAQQQQPKQLPIPDSNQPIQLSFNNEINQLNGKNNDDNNAKSINNDLTLSESKSPAIDELSLDSSEDAADLDDRNKRFLSFGGGGLAGGSSGPSGSTAGKPGGSGNFLFDVVRLFSGSVQTQAGDEAANDGSNSVSGSGDTDSDSDANRAADGYTEGIPGPVTRLVVLANRGLANLIQDLILRVAATSEKFVNFKAKLITALI